MLKLNNNRSDYESDELINRVMKMCLVTRENIDEGLLEMAKVMAKCNMMVLENNFPLFELFTDIKIRNTAVCCDREMN
jgi:hypothetical protein